MLQDPVVTIGFGPNATVAFVITLGFGVSAVSPAQPRPPTYVRDVYKPTQTTTGSAGGG